MSPLVEKMQEKYLEQMGAAFRKAALECVADLVDEIAPPWRQMGGDGAEQDITLEAWNSALDIFTDELRENLLLDPEPLVWGSGERSAYVPLGHPARLYTEFKPRFPYSINPNDYPNGA